MAASLLTVDGMTMRFGGIVADENVSFVVEEGSITARPRGSSASTSPRRASTPPRRSSYRT